LAFSRLKNLERFKLQSNNLTEIQPSNLFLLMPKLISIDLQRNQLIQIPTEFPLSLRELELGNNRLKTLTINNNNTFQFLTLDLSSNPLNCDCNIKTFSI
jgi:Leucine-rich repeat (LRR) protein